MNRAYARRARTGFAVVLASFAATAAAGDVHVERAAGGAKIVRDGEPYFVKGVGVDKGSIAVAAKLGANCVRTWGADGLDQVLEEAQRNGMTVCAGIWLGHERHGFRYDDPAQVARQKEDVRRVIERYRSHPALLVWGIGNEMEGDGKNPAIWAAVEDLAAMVKQLDPDHPTMTVISEFGDDPAKIKGTHDICKSVDIVGLNSYGPVATLADRYRRLGGTKPYLLTEFGPRGWWESTRTSWGAALEPTSTEKVEMYRSAYESSVLGQPLCLGSYAFLWGWKQEATATWFGLVLPTGERLPATDLLSSFWSGRAVENRAPSVEPLKLEAGAEATAGSDVRVRLAVTDPEGDPLQVVWELQREGTPKGGGDAEPDPGSYPDAIQSGGLDGAVVRLPKAPGGYRVFATIRDGHGGAATANLPLHVGPVK